MSSQETLDNSPPTLDSTCSELKVWPRFASIRMDNRLEARPDIVASAAFLPFRDKTFAIIYCDPPFFIRKRIRGTRSRSKLDRGFIRRMERYGSWGTREAWERFLQRTNIEFERCLRDAGELQFKLMDSKEDVKLKDLELLTNFRITASRRWQSKTAPFIRKLGRTLTQGQIGIFTLRRRMVQQGAD